MSLYANVKEELMKAERRKNNLSENLANYKAKLYEKRQSLVSRPGTRAVSRSPIPMATRFLSSEKLKKITKSTSKSPFGRERPGSRKFQ